LGLVLIAAMARGKPVVASSLPGDRAVVDDGVDGLLVRPGDARHLAAHLDELLQNRPLAARLGAAGRTKAERRYDWPLIGERLEELYRAAVTG
jgi:glycosyltransferase involved in cell wall biosynthesis